MTLLGVMRPPPKDDVYRGWTQLIHRAAEHPVGAGKEGSGSTRQGMIVRNPLHRERTGVCESPGFLVE